MGASQLDIEVTMVEMFVSNKVILRIISKCNFEG